MSIGIPSVNDLKEAVLATTRALSQKADLDRDFRSNEDLEFTLPAPPKNKSELAFYRGKADAMACAKRFRDDEIFIDTGAQKLNSLLENLEDVRVEVLGSKRYPGVSANIKAKFEQECRENFLLEDKEDLLESALEAWLRQILLKEIPTKSALNSLKPWKKLLNEKGSIFKKELEDTLDDQIKFSETARKLLHALQLDKSEDNLDEDQQIPDPNDSDSENLESENQELSTEPEVSEIDSEQESQETDLDMNEIDDDSIVDENEEVLSNKSWLEKLVEQTTNFTYKIYTRDFDEELPPDQICSSEELIRLRKHLDQLMGSSKSTVAKLANRLQRFLLAQQNRSWEFNKEEGLLDTSKLHKIVIDPVTPLTYKIEKDTEFRDTVVSLLVDSSGSMRGRSMTVAAICADIISTTLERCNVKTEVLGFTTRQWKGGESRKRWVEPVKTA